MKSRRSYTLLVGAGALALAFSATTTEAQTTRRASSSVRIPLSKDKTAPVDTTTPAPAPAPAPAPVAVVVIDSTPAPTPVVEPAPVYEAPRPMRRRYGNGFYIGLGAGAGIPTQAIRNAYDPGVAIEVPIGYDAPFSPLGFRVNFGYTQFNSRSTFRNQPGTPPSAAITTINPQVWSALADAKLRLPFLGTFGGGSTSGLYAVAGAGVNHFRNYSTTFAVTNPDLQTTTTTTTNESVTRFAANAGGGLSYGFGAAEVYLESRYVSTFLSNRHASYVPIILGIAFH